MKIPSTAQLGNIIASNSGGYLGYWTLLDHDTQLEVVAFDSFFGFGFSKKSSVVQYPIENGSFTTYNKQNMPYSLNVVLVKSGLSFSFQKQKFIDTLKKYCNDALLVDVVTPSGSYQSCTISGLDFKNSSEENADMIMANLSITEVRNIYAIDSQTTKTLNASQRIKQGLKSLVGI